MKYLKIITTTIVLITFAMLSSKNAQAQAVKFEYDAAGNMIKRMADVVCNTDLTVNNNRTGTKLDRIYASSGTITTQTFSTLGGADVTVRENETVDFKADHITLQPGFKVELNARFNAVIEPCEQ